MISLPQISEGKGSETLVAFKAVFYKALKEMTHSWLKLTLNLVS